MTVFTTIDQVQAAVATESMELRHGGTGASTWYEVRTLDLQVCAGYSVNYGETVCQWHTKAEVLSWANRYISA
jgi:hypothetical protein